MFELGLSNRNDCCHVAVYVLSMVVPSRHHPMFELGLSDWNVRVVDGDSMQALFDV